MYTYDHINTVQDLIEMLETHNPDMMVRAGRYDTWGGKWDLSFLSTSTLFTDEQGVKDLSDRERDKDIETLTIY